MKRLFLVVLAVGILFLTPNAASAQSTNLGGGARPTQEQSLQDLVNEVRQLRTMLQRMTITNYKTNLVVERLKFQQEMVARLNRELNDARESLAETRVVIARMKQRLSRLQEDVGNGFKTPEELADLKMELESLSQREGRLILRETQVMNDLSTERMKLEELSAQLTKLELELR